MKKFMMILMGLSLAAKGEDQVPESWDVTCEIFSVPLSEVAAMKRKAKSNAEDYQALVKGVEKDKVGLEEFLMVRAIEGESTTVEEISEMIYASEYDPAELPNDIGDLAENLEVAKSLVTPANPTAFETKSVGTTMELELSDPGEGHLDLRMTVTLVSHLGREEWGQGVAKAEMPRFAVQSVKSGIEVKLDSPTLLGSISPPAALQPEKGEKQVWLAFVTISESKE